MRENFINFGTSALASSITNTATSLSVTAGSGSSFPTTNFVVCIDTELLFISSRSSDTFTIATRGGDGTTAAAHNSATTVQLSVCAYNMNHIWSNVADTFNPDVPPIQRSISATGVPNGSASSYDNEFESLGSWTLYPTSLPTGATFDVGASVASHLTLKRGTSNDNTLYTAYVPFVPGSSAWTATCKMSDSSNTINLGSQSVEFHFLVTDQGNPTGTADPGNSMRIDVVLNATVTSNVITGNRSVRPSRDVSSVWNAITPSIVVPWPVPLYLRMNNDGAGRFQLFFGDGITYSLLVDTTFSFTAAALAMQWYSASGNTNASHNVLVDWVRVVMGTRLQYWG